jgi:hypothetical protein
MAPGWAPVSAEGMEGSRSGVDIAVPTLGLHRWGPAAAV